MKERLNKTSGLIGCSANLAFASALMFIRIPQNTVSWTLWTVMNGLIFFSMRASGNKKAWLPLGYTVSAGLVTLTLLSHGVWHFGVWEGASIAGVVLALGLWKAIGPRFAVIAGTAASSMAGIPAVHDAWLHPDPASWWLWSTCAFAGILAALTVEKWSIEHSVFPVGSFLFNFGMFLLVIR